MQLMIDISVETPAALRLAASFLNQHAALREAMENNGQPAEFGDIGNVPMGTPAAPVPFPASATSNIATAPSVQTNVVPLHPNAPIAQTPDISTQMQNSGTVTAPPAPLASFPTPGVGTTLAPPAPVNYAHLPPTAGAQHATTGAATTGEQYDKAGVPWDARIHQKHKSVKKDGTWKLQKGISEDVVRAVMAELAPRIRHLSNVPVVVHTPTGHELPPVPTSAPVTVGASAPVPLPPVPPVPTGPQAPPAPVQHAQAYNPQVGYPPIPTVAQAPPAPTETPAVTQDPFRALIAKITEARSKNRITAEEVTACVAGAGVPSLQLLNNMPAQIPTVEASIDAILATR